MLARNSLNVLGEDRAFDGIDDVPTSARAKLARLLRSEHQLRVMGGTRGRSHTLMYRAGARARDVCLRYAVAHVDRRGCDGKPRKRVYG